MIPVWYSFRGGKPKEEGLYFHKQEDFPWTSELLSNIDTIRTEISALVEKERASMPVYFNTELVEKGSKWKTFPFMFWDVKVHKNIKRSPLSLALIQKIPGLISCSISVLEAGSRIKPHRGDTNAIIRCHLPITIPGKLPESGFTVGNQTREWKEGELLLFNDSEKHEAWNFSDKPRTILILDIIRPEFINKKSSICLNVLSGLVLQLVAGTKFTRFIYMNRKIRLATQKIIYVMLLVYVPMYKLSLRFKV